MTHYKDRHGKLRWRYRSKGFTANLGTEYASDEFKRRYSLAVKGERITPQGETVQRVSQAPKGSLANVVESWFKSAHFKSLGDSTKANYRRLANKLKEEHGHRPIKGLDRATVRKLMAAKAETPAAANSLLRILRFVLDHAMDDLELIETNPARSVKNLKLNNPDGFHTWTEEEIDKFYEFWKLGTVADLAMTLMLYTGASRGDAVRLGPSNVHDGRIVYHRKKMESRTGVKVDIPIHPELEKRLALVDEDKDTFLETNRGEQRSPGGLGNSIRKWCDKAELPECTSHGLRKAIARRLAEAGSTPHEIMAVTGHETLSEVTRYTKKAQRASLADSALGKTK